MARNENEGKTFLDTLFDSAEEVVGGMERFADGNQGVLPMAYTDGSRVIADSIAGGRESTGGEPNWLYLRFYNADGSSYTRKYVRDPSPPRVVDVGEKR